MKNFLNSRFLLIIGLILFAAFSRLLPHPNNFTPLMAISLFTGAFISDRRLAFVLPLTAMLISDAIIGFYPFAYAIYLSFGVAVVLGITISKKVNLINVIAVSFASSISFFILTNFVYWLASGGYPMNLAGLADCYIKAIPFYRNMIAGDGIYVFVLFGAFALAEKFVPALQKVKN
ncbi:MAG: hypothetical protein NT007_08515 [Candidatus Kapabacteria bacterium]|nr:hypothetical protein [Candidatus Kapabacteria bacterium]